MKTNYTIIVVLLSFCIFGFSKMKAQTPCQANFVWADSLCTVFFTSTSTGVGSGTYYMWNFGDGNYGYAPNVTNTYSGSGMYYVCLTIIDSVAGCFDQECDTVTVNCASSVYENAASAGTLSNYPNPCSESTTINFEIAESGNVKLSVYNLLGEEAAVILNEKKEKGNHRVEFNSGNLSPGMYLLRLQLNGKSAMQKISIVK